VSNPERDSEAVFPPKTSAEPKQQPSSVPILKRSLLFGFLYAAAIAVVGGGVAWLSVGPIGALSVVIGAVMAAVVLGITAASILVAIKYDIVAFFAIVLGAWLIKFVIFLVLAILLRDQPWINISSLFLALIAGVIGSLVVDVVVVMKTRMPYISDPIG
jgi:hypothetical protein